MGNKILGLVFIYFFLALPCLAAQPLDVVINEVCWMGSGISANDEWVELYNNTSSVINLNGWKLISKDGSPEIELEGEITARSFFILERTDDESVPNITADQIYKGALKNKGEFLQLTDDKGNVVDEIDCSDGWFKGDNKTKNTMERVNSKLAGSNRNNWQTSQDTGGTPRAQNSRGIKLVPEEETEKSEVVDIEQQQPQQTITYASGILINEILPSPEGPDKENEYIEIFNQNNVAVNLAAWSLQDVEGATKTFTFPGDTEIGPKKFLVFFRPETKITLNNSGDGLKLFKPNKEIADQIYYEKALQGESFNRVGDDWVWTPNLTPGAENIFPKIDEEKTEGEEEGIIEIEKKELLGALSEILPGRFLEEESSKNFSFVLAIALILALSSGILILVLKKKISLSKKAPWTH